MSIFAKIFQGSGGADLTDLIGQVAAIGKSQAVIEFNLDGTIIKANDNFLNAMGYTLDEVKGKHHRIFVEPAYGDSDEYREFWQKLNRGEFVSDEFKRLAKGGKEIWIQASYNPILDSDGKPFKVVKYATDITQNKKAVAEIRSSLAKMAEGDFTCQIETPLVGEYEDIRAAMNSTVGNVKSMIDDMEETSIVTGRIKIALDGCKTNVMLADNDLNIIYMNNTMREMMQANEAAIKTELPNFDASKLIGTCVDVFHKDPAHQRGMIEKLSGTYETRIKVGGRTFDLIANPVIDESGTRLGTSVEWADVSEILAEEEKAAKIAAANARIKIALDGCKTNVMLADNDLNIIYMNDTMREMMLANEAAIKTELQDFDSSKLIGTCVDVFHKNPAHQRGMIEKLSGTYETRIKVGGRTFDLIANPVIDNGTRLGTSVEWSDVSERLAEEEKAAKLAAANARIKIALDGCKTNVMLADNDLNIIYMNDTMREMMQANEAAIKTELTGFDASKLIGTCVDVFHKNPAHQRGMIEKLAGTYETRIKVGGRTFDLIANPVIDNGTRLGTSVEWSDVSERLAEEEKAAKLAAANARIKTALDKCSTNVMMADVDCNVIYMNESVTAMLKNAESDLQKVLPNFRVDKVLGSCIDIFHKDPSHQRAMLDKLTATYTTEIQVANRKFGLVANPVNDDQGNRIGTVVEWNDVTLERQVEDELADIVNEIAAGNFTSRINMEGKSGFMANMAEGVNIIAQTCEKGLADVVRMLRALAEGNLNERIDAEYQGTFDDLKQASNSSAEKLGEIVNRIAESASEVSTAASQISEGSSDLSERTEAQASALEETAAAMEQMASTVKSNSENAQQADQLGRDARAVATSGGEVVEKAVAAMAGIEESSQKISDIIGVIDEIAFQTNLLALNAAVEAARAGDAGKGFAVVASEVRTLAQRSSEAAKDIKNLILDSGNQVKGGVTLVNDVGKALGEILSSITNVTEIISEIAAASEEQATGIDEINRSVTEMDDMTQQNSALVEENAASARSLEEQASEMNDQLSFFTVSNAIAGNTRKALPNPPAGQRKPAPAANAGRPAQAAAKPKQIAKSASSDFDNEDWSEF